MNNTFFVGIVEDVQDPLQLGRVRVRVFGVHSESLSDIPTDSLPWAIPLMPATSASLSGIGHSGIGFLPGTMVFLFFQDGESRQQPVILGSAHGIPTNKNPLSISTSETFVSSTNTQSQTSEVKAVAGPNLVDTSGTPVVDSSGAPVTVGNLDTVTPPVDISRMVAKFGSNVTLVYNELMKFGIKEPNAIVAILSNVAKECSFKLVRESLKYSSVARLKAIFPSKFGSMSDSDAQQYINNEVALANLVYSNRYGNGSVASGDGYNYRGGGFIQLTFKSNYSTVGSKIGVDLVSAPDKINDSSIAAKAVSQFFINAFGGAGRLSFSSLEEALTTVTKKVNAGGFANDYPKVKGYSTLCTIVTDTAAATASANEIEKPNDPTNDVNSSTTTEQINSGVKSKNSTSGAESTGFKDPTGKYPIAGMLNEQDTSRLSRRNTKNTNVEKKLKSRRTGIPSISGTFSEPAPAYNAQYPYNHVYSTESGHTLEFDDTPGNERIHLYHSAGTYTEIDKYGNQVNKIVGDNFSITERNGYIYIDGTARITIGSDVKLTIGGNLDISVDGNLNYDIGGSVTWKIGGDQTSGIGGNNSIQSSGSTDIDSSTINLNSGSSVSISPSARSGTSNDYSVQTPENYVGATSINFDDGDEASVDAHRAEELSKGTITQKELDDGDAVKPIEEDKVEPINSIDSLPESCTIFANKKDIPDSTQISKYFSIGMLSSNAIVSHYKLAPQHKLSVPELACNLKNLAENCLDKIKAKYPNMSVTSAFRTGTSTSQHELGMAADMQFSGVGKSEYYNIAGWIKNNVLFDQLLLEYKTTGTGLPWIHISFNSNGNRKQVMTFMNNKKVDVGLIKLEA